MQWVRMNCLFSKIWYLNSNFFPIAYLLTHGLHHRLSILVQFFQPKLGNLGMILQQISGPALEEACWSMPASGGLPKSIQEVELEGRQKAAAVWRITIMVMIRFWNGLGGLVASRHDPKNLHRQGCRKRCSDKRREEILGCARKYERMENLRFLILWS